MNGIYSAPRSAQAVLDKVCTLEDYTKANRIVIRRNHHGIDCYAIRFEGSDFDIHVGITADAAHWVLRKNWLFPFDRLSGVVWC